MGIDLGNNGWISVPWAEYIGKDASHGASFSSGWDQGNQAVFNILIGWEDGLQAEEDLLGISYFDGASLHRTPPVRHPYKPWLRAERIISAHPVRWDEKLNQPASLYGNGASVAQTTMSAFDYWLLSIGFVAPLYRIVDDTTLGSYFGGNEWNRFCIVEQEDEFLTITREAGTWKWADIAAGPGLAAWNNNKTNSAFNAPWGQTIHSWRIKVIWKRVPRFGLFALGGTSDFLNANISTSGNYLHNGATTLWNVSTANNLGNASSSVLKFINAHATPIASPFSPLSQYLDPVDPNLYYDVTLNWHWFDPPYGNSDYRGHNLAPSPDLADPYWYLITNAGFNTSTGAVAGQSVYPTKDLTTVFQLSET